MTTVFTSFSLQKDGIVSYANKAAWLKRDKNTRKVAEQQKIWEGEDSHLQTNCQVREKGSKYSQVYPNRFYFCQAVPTTAYGISVKLFSE